MVPVSYQGFPGQPVLPVTRARHCVLRCKVGFSLPYIGPSLIPLYSYSIHQGEELARPLNKIALDIEADEGAGPRAQKASQLRWDKRKKRFVQGDQGSANVKMIRTESGTRLPASFQSGRYNKWKAQQRSAPASDSRDTGGSDDNRRISRPQSARTNGHSTSSKKGHSELLDAHKIRKRRSVQTQVSRFAVKETVLTKIVATK